jgi:hypothetical protein
MKRTVLQDSTAARRHRRALAVTVMALGIGLAIESVATPPAALAAPPASDAPTVASLASLLDKDLHWGMSHAQVTDVYNRIGGLFDHEYAPQLSRLQPGIQMQTVEADRENRKASFEHSFARFIDPPTGYDSSALKKEYTYKNDEAIQAVFKDGKQRYFFYIKDKFWKLYEEVPLKADGPLGETYAGAVTKLSQALGAAGRLRAANPDQGVDRTTTDWQDSSTHLRVIDRSGEHILGFVLEDRRTLVNLDSLRANKAVDPFAIDPTIAAITKKGISDPSAVQTPDGGAKSGKKGK